MTNLDRKHDATNPLIELGEEGVVRMSWYGTRVLQEIAGKRIIYMRDGFIEFEDRTSAGYTRVQDSRGDGSGANILEVELDSRSTVMEKLMRTMNDRPDKLSR